MQDFCMNRLFQIVRSLCVALLWGFVKPGKGEDLRGLIRSPPAKRTYSCHNHHHHCHHIEHISEGKDWLDLQKWLIVVRSQKSDFGALIRCSRWLLQGSPWWDTIMIAELHISISIYISIYSTKMLHDCMIARCVNKWMHHNINTQIYYMHIY